MFSYLIFRLAVFLARHLPERWGVAIARWIGSVVYRFSPLSEAGRDNMRHILGPGADPDQVSRLAREAVQNRMLNYYDLVRLSGIPLDEIVSRAAIEGLEHVDQLVESKQGAIIITGHVGPMEFFIQAVSVLGYPIIGITEHLEPERFHQYMTDLRSAHGLDLISTQGSLLDAYRRLKQGGLLATALDRDSTDTGLIVDIFGAPAWMPDGYARLAVRANAPLIYGFCRRTGDGAAARVYPLLYPDRSLGKEEAVRDLIQRTISLFEATLREHPYEWHLSTPIWRVAQERLAGEASR